MAWKCDVADPFTEEGIVCVRLLFMRPMSGSNGLLEPVVVSTLKQIERLGYKDFGRSLLAFTNREETAKKRRKNEEKEEIQK